LKRDSTKDIVDEKDLFIEDLKAKEKLDKTDLKRLK